MLEEMLQFLIGFEDLLRKHRADRAGFIGIQEPAGATRTGSDQAVRQNKERLHAVKSGA